MRFTLIAVVLAFLPGCAALSAIGLGTTDVLPSLKYCDDVQYVRSQTVMEIRAKCKVPAG